MDLQWRQRRRRIRAWLKPLPRRANVQRYPVIKWFAEFAYKRPYLWSFKNAAVVRAIYIGSLLTFMPTYGVQIPLAFAGALVGRANLSVLVGLQMLNNPLTLGPIYLASYAIGTWLMSALRISSAYVALNGALALIAGGLVLGLVTALLLHSIWLVGRYEAKQFRRKRLARSKNIYSKLP
jgi:uncharacterized protein (DUF2062 family)